MVKIQETKLNLLKYLSKENEFITPTTIQLPRKK